MSEWTPGPHRVDGKNKTTEVGGFYLVWGRSELLAYVAERGDAKLYAAAPDLYEALERTRNALEALGGINGEACKAAEAALSKARGEAQ